jgi:hypothetical protein
VTLLDLVPAGISAPIECDGGTHRLEWVGRSAGGLRACGHDATAEDVLRALGGDRPRCVELAARWHDHRLEPLLLVAMLTGDADLLSRQTFVTVGPPIPVTRGVGLYRHVEALVELAPALRRVLAADSAVAYSATDLLRTGAPDNTSAVRSVVRRQLAEAAMAAFDVEEVDAAQVWVTDDADPPVLFVRSRRGGALVLAGKVPVRWAATWVLGLARREGRLVVDVRADGRGGVELLGYTLGRRDPDLAAFVDRVPERTVRRRIEADLGG